MSKISKSKARILSKIIHPTAKERIESQFKGHTGNPEEIKKSIIEKMKKIESERKGK